MSQEEPEPRDQDYRSDTEHVQKPSNIVMLRMLPPNATVNEVCVSFISCYEYSNHFSKHLWHTVTTENETKIELHLLSNRNL